MSRRIVLRYSLDLADMPEVSSQNTVLGCQCAGAYRTYLNNVLALILYWLVTSLLIGIMAFTFLTTAKSRRMSHQILFYITPFVLH